VIEPILNPLWVLIAIGERPAPLALVGAAIVLSAVVLRAAASIRNQGRVTPAAVSTG
jgi:drug/metabolite transporter (DMT)-like permease